METVRNTRGSTKKDEGWWLIQDNELLVHVNGFWDWKA